MNYLLYSSNEMFSSTTLIRQSKQIFDKLNTNEITKAVILRDGKPSFIMLEFDKYEAMMSEYEVFKEAYLKLKQTKIQTTNQKEIQMIEQSNSVQDTIDAEQITGPQDFEIDSSDIGKDHSNAQIKEFWN